MLHDNLRVGAYPKEPPDDPFEDTWVRYDPDQFASFFPDSGGSLRGRESPNGQYLACWREREKERRGEQYPGGICFADNHEVTHVAELADVSALAPANDGTVAGLVNAGERFLVFDSDGSKRFEDSFESNVGALAITPDGGHVAIATAFPDNAVHLYETETGRYLGRTENSTTSVLGDLQFGTDDGDRVVETYDVGPDSDLDVHENRTGVIDRIPVAPQMDVQSLSGVCLHLNESDSEFHYVPTEELEDISGRLRIPDVQVTTACDTTVEPIDVNIVFHDPKEAIESQFSFCSDCKEAAATYPDEKTEKTHP